ncbi:MAG: Exopolyphosphatase [Cirrosporium novae-zelandiae]|nr:MAG: Exopolyphosphatase [Cirrosporium novae-zelandiae]
MASSLHYTSLSTFISSARSTLQEALGKGSAQNLTFVLGNESADLDSLSCSVLLAYLGTYSSCSTANIHIPLLPIRNSYLRLRPEFTFALSHASQVPPSSLLTLDDIPLSPNHSDSLPPNRTKWILVDHNKMTGPLSAIYGDQVVGCIDHHELETEVPSNPEEKWVVEKCGSCTSLVVREMRDTWNALPSEIVEGSKSDSDSELILLALSAILIDTSNLSPSAGKTKLVDIEAVEFLEARLPPSSGYDRTSYFKQVTQAKSSIEYLSLNEILVKDYKQWTEGNGLRLGVSAAVKPLSFLQKKSRDETKSDEFEHVLRQFAQKKDLSIYAIMTAFTNQEGEFERELALLPMNEHGEEVLMRFQGVGGQKLRLEKRDGEIDATAGGKMKMWQQRELTASRKQVAPLLRKYMDGNGP